MGFLLYKLFGYSASCADRFTFKDCREFSQPVAWRGPPEVIPHILAVPILINNLTGTIRDLSCNEEPPPGYACSSCRPSDRRAQPGVYPKYVHLQTALLNEALSNRRYVRLGITQRGGRCVDRVGAED